MKIILTHGYTDSNKGDAAIALGTIAMICRTLPGAEISSHSIYSEKHAGFASHSIWTRRAGVPVIEGVLPSPYLDDAGSGLLHHARAGLRLGWEMLCLMALWFMPNLTWLHPQKARAMKEIRGADLVIVRGGQYLHNESGRVRGLVYLARMLLNIAIPIWLDRPTVIWGMSIGPVHGALAARWLRDTIRGCDQIVVRETLSADYLRGLGVVEKVSVAPDLAFVTRPAGTLPAEDSLPARPWIGVTAINWSFPGTPQPAAAQRRYLEAMVEALVTCYRRYGLSPVLVAQVTAQHHGQHDRPLLASLVERLKSAGVSPTMVTEDLSPAELSAFYGQCDVVLATRLHTVILAACAGTPAVAIRYQGFKTQGIMRSLDLERYTHDITALSGVALTQSLVDVLSRQAELRADITSRVEENRRAIANSAETILAPFRHKAPEGVETPANAGDVDAHSPPYP